MRHARCSVLLVRRETVNGLEPITMVDECSHKLRPG